MTTNVFKAAVVPVIGFLVAVFTVKVVVTATVTILVVMVAVVTVVFVTYSSCDYYNGCGCSRAD